MAERQRGYYWVGWSGWVDAETAERFPGPMLGLWDGQVWWFTRMDRYRFDTEVIVLGERLVPPRAAPGVRKAYAATEARHGWS
jgi:hypothetical protein